MNLEHALIITPILSASCTLLSGGLAVYFLRHRKRRIGIAMTGMLAGECIGMAVVTTFATLEWAGGLAQFDPMHATYIRWAAIAATAASSIHLSYQVKKVIAE